MSKALKKNGYENTGKKMEKPEKWCSKKPPPPNKSGKNIVIIVQKWSRLEGGWGEEKLDKNRITLVGELKFRGPIMVSV